MKRYVHNLNRIKLRAIVVALFAGALTYVVFLAFAAIGPATLYTNPGGTQSVARDSNFIVNARISTASNVPVTGGSIYMTYPADKVQVVSINYSGSPYTTPLFESNVGGVLRMDRAALPKVSGGDNLFAQVQFKAIAAGAASISFNSSSYVTSGDDDSNLPLTRQGVTYNISAPVTPPPPPAPAPSPSPNSPSSPAPAPTSSAPSPATTAPKSTTGTRATSPQTSPVINSTATNTQPRAGSASPDAASTASPSSYQVQFMVTDGAKKAVPNAEVIIGDTTNKTDRSGRVTFTGISAGQHLVTVRHYGKDTVSNITVSPIDPTVPQSFNLVAGQSLSIPSLTSFFFWMLILVLLPVVVVATIAVFQYLRKRQAENALNNTNIPLAPEPATSAVISAGPVEVRAPGISPGTVFHPEPKVVSTEKRSK